MVSSKMSLLKLGKVVRITLPTRPQLKGMNDVTNYCLGML